MNNIHIVSIGVLIALCFVNLVISDVSHLVQQSVQQQVPLQHQQQRQQQLLQQQLPQQQLPQQQLPQQQLPQQQLPQQQLPQQQQQLASGAVGNQNFQPVVTETCLGCICEAISGCNRTTTCNGDVCGLFRITWAYWADSGKPTVAGELPSSQTAYPNCANDPYCAASTVQGYMSRFGQDCNGDGIINCYDHAAIHVKGGYGCRNELPEKYNQVLQSCVGQFLKN